MNTKTIYTAITVITLFMSTSVTAHDPSMHAATKEKPNCAAMHKMDSPKMDMSDPVMQAMMKQCGKSSPEGHHNMKSEKPVCTEEHQKLGHCTLESGVSDTRDSVSADSEINDD
ncbi:MAG: hypothetical protein ACI9XU_000756 [Arenicella sp.]|jgi:hypothetical protein